jgi:threonine dehydrogenase-like Zn-dependent dehydrogenase
MRALVSGHALELRDNYPDPTPSPGESIVRVELAGICGTDLELTRGYMGFSGVPGHEFVGRVIDSEDKSLIGQRVAGEINAGCGHCRSCIETDSRHCSDRTVLGILGRDGAFAEYLRLPNRNLLPVSAAISDEAAVLIEPLAAAFEIFTQIEIAADASILILGDGRLGALTGLALKANGYKPVIAGHHQAKLARLSAFGLTAATTEDMRRLHDVVIDCTGNPDGFTQALASVRPRGTIVLKSTAAVAANLNLAPIVINEITVIGSRCGRFQPAIEALANGRIDPSPLIDGIYPLDEPLAAFQAATDPLKFKILLRP